jgi:nicotinamide-nucleotide amidase
MAKLVRAVSTITSCTLPYSERDVAVICELAAHLLLANSWYLVTAESCTGGLIAATCTELPGSSQWFERGFVTYSNAAKMELLDVDGALIGKYGAVSEPVVRAMAAGALRHANAQVAIAVTGVAGPTGGSIDKPVGTVWFGFALPSGITTERLHFEGDRTSVRQGAVRHALTRLTELINGEIGLENSAC